MEANSMDLKEKVRNLPLSPGVYLMKDSSGSIIYVGKSKNLKNRVGSYFQNSKNHTTKVEKLVKNLKDFDYMLTDTEFEAFMLECKLIKDLKPTYNKMMKNPLSYTYIRINLHEYYPGIQVVSEYVQDDDSLYFGPYTSKNTVERAVQGIKECCRILCSNSLRTSTACLNYSLGLCIGMCLGDSSKKEYDIIIDKIIKLLNGSDKSILEEMEEKMNTASEKFDFETAAKYRDYISAVNYLLSSKKVISFAEENKNIAMLEYIDDSCFKFFLIKGKEVLFKEKYNINDIDLEQFKAKIQDMIICLFKDEAAVTSLERVSKYEIDEAQIVYSYLKNSKCKYAIIPDKWLDNNNMINLKEEIDKLFSKDSSL